MRKSLVAVALAFAFPTAFAQTTVTLYGIVDVGVERLDVGDISGTRLQSGISAGSRWGIRGSEDLGGGYRALFTLENRFEADTGSLSNNNVMYWCKPASATSPVPICPGVGVVTIPSAAVVGGMNSVNDSLLRGITTVNGAGAIFDRQAWVGVVTPFGAILAGRQYTPGYEILNKFNIMGDQMAIQFGGSYATLNIRANNSIQYRAEMKGFIGTFMYGFGGTDGSRNERSGAPQNGDDFMGANLQYVTDRWGVGAGWNRNNVVPYATTTLAGGPPTKKTGLETINLGGFATFGSFKFTGQWMKRTNDNPLFTPNDIQNIVVAGGTPAGISAILGPATASLNPFDIDTMRGLVGPTDTDAYHLGASWRYGNGTLYGVYNWAKDTARSAWATQDAKANHFGVGYIYDFSRRTQLYTDAGWMKNSGQARGAFPSAGYTTGWTTAAGEDATIFQLGMRHYF